MPKGLRRRLSVMVHSIEDLEQELTIGGDRKHNK